MALSPRYPGNITLGYSTGHPPLSSIYFFINPTICPPDTILYAIGDLHQEKAHSRTTIGHFTSVPPSNNGLGALVERLGLLRRRHGEWRNCTAFAGRVDGRRRCCRPRERPRPAPPGLLLAAPDPFATLTFADVGSRHMAPACFSRLVPALGADNAARVSRGSSLLGLLGLARG